MRRRAPRSRARTSIGPRDLRAQITSVAKSVLVALFWVLLGLGSLASTVLALWITLSLARAAGDGPDGVSASAPWLWFVAIVVTLGVPFAIATWKHQGDARRISLSMTWLPMLWNTSGLLLATQMIPDITAAALRSHGAWIAADRFGDSHSATRVMSALGHHTADAVGSRGETDVAGPPPLLLVDSDKVDRTKALSVPFTEEGTAILMDVTLEGPSGSAKLTYLFDTGASFTTISSATAAKLGVVVPDDAPTLTFNTASGPRESRMVYLPGLSLGEVHIEGLLVSVCDGCVNERSSGLLGHNVMREFFAQIDYKSQRMVLLPRVPVERPDRSYDIEPVVELRVDGPAEVWLGRVRWVVRVHNRGSVPIRDVVPIVKFADGPVLRGASIGEIAPGATGRSLVDGRATFEGGGDSKGHYTLGLAEAFW
jgi:hypothetical protein